jgi:PiT family inorganic phosphate transporter
LLISPLLGFVLSYLLLRLVLFSSQKATPRVNVLFKRLQILSALLLALSHGSNDAQKSIGIIAMGLVATQYSSNFEVPLWSVFVGAGSLALGAGLGGTRVIRTVGVRIFRIRPVHGFTAQVASTLTVLGANVSGQPISTTQVIGGAITGAGSSERFSRVRWYTVGNIALAWLVTLPATAAIAGLLWMALSELTSF